MKKKIKKGICVYCGKLKEITKDHVPPECFFPKPKPSNLITVPSCVECNRGAGKDEEFFLATFMFSEVGVTEAGKMLWNEKLHRMYEKNLGLRGKIAKSLHYSDIYTPAGIFLGRRMVIDQDTKSFDKVVNKILRGLYYFEFSELLPANTEVLCHFLQKLLIYLL